MNKQEIVLKKDVCGSTIINRQHFSCPLGQGFELTQLLSELKEHDEIILYFPKRTKYITYSTSRGFNIIESEYNNINDARDNDNDDIIEYVSEMNPKIVEVIRGLLK